jgi:ubiquinone biosynthesis protein
MLDRLAVFLDRNQHKWNAYDLKFKDTLDRVRWMIKSEIDLSAEQENIKRARRYYRHQKYIAVPYRYPCSTPRMTVMSRLEGRKITDVGHLSNGQRRKLASLVAQVCIVKPLQDLQAETMFHGDPHAGNIAYRFNGPQPQILLYDWGMMGRLNRLERLALGLMATGIMTHSVGTIVYAIDLLSPDRPQKSTDRRHCHAAIARVLTRNQGPRKRGMLSTTGEIFEELTYLGVVFPPHILLFGKAMVTLHGVLSDIDPTFNRDDYVLCSVLREFFGNWVSLRLHWFLLEQSWLFYGYGFERLFDLQNFFWTSAMRFGFAGSRL